MSSLSRSVIFALGVFSTQILMAAAPKVVFIGDSLTAGYGVASSESYPIIVKNKLKTQKIEIEVVNSSVSGSTSASGLSRLNWVLKSKPAVVVIALGSNDGLRGFPVTDTKKNLEDMIKAAQAEGVKVVLAGLEVPVNYGERYRKEFREIYTSLSKQYKTELVPFLLDGVAGEKKMNQADSIHPNADGYQKVADNVLPALKRALGK